MQRSYRNLLIETFQTGLAIRTGGLSWVLKELRRQGMQIKMNDLQEYMPFYLDKTSLRYLYDLHSYDQSVDDLLALQKSLLDFY